jgi:hypothetical protein
LQDSTEQTDESENNDLITKGWRQRPLVSVGTGSLALLAQAPALTSIARNLAIQLNIFRFIRFIPFIPVSSPK